MNAIEWRQVPDYPMYEVSNMGFVRRVGTHRQLKPIPSRAPNRLNYQHVNLYRGAYGHRTMKNRKLHTVVLEAFVGPRPEGMECRHLNGDPSDNRLSNLRWGTPKENGEDRVAHGTQVKGGDCHSAYLTELQVRAARVLWDAGMGLNELMELFAVKHKMTLHKAVIGKSWKQVA